MKPVKHLWKKVKVTNAAQFQCAKWTENGKQCYELKVISVKVKPFERLVLGIDLYPGETGTFTLTDYKVVGIGEYTANVTHAKPTFTVTVPNGETERKFDLIIHFEGDK